MSTDFFREVSLPYHIDTSISPDDDDDDDEWNSCFSGHFKCGSWTLRYGEALGDWGVGGGGGVKLCEF